MAGDQELNEIADPPTPEHRLSPSADSLILRAARYAARCHSGQWRKYHGRPYIEHPGRVAARLMVFPDATPEEAAAAWLHDVIEDCGETADTLLEAGFPPRTVDLVLELTNPSKGRPELPRRERKALDLAHLRGVSPQAQRLKLLDRIDNLRDMAACSDGFRSLYAAETVQLAAAIGGQWPALAEELLLEIERLGFARDHRDGRAG